MARTEPRQLEIIAKPQATPNMPRITLGGPGMADFPADQTSAHVKLRPGSDLHISSDWKTGSNEGSHKSEKREDADAAAS